MNPAGDSGGRHKLQGDTCSGSARLSKRSRIGATGCGLVPYHTIVRPNYRGGPHRSAVRTVIESRAEIRDRRQLSRLNGPDPFFGSDPVRPSGAVSHLARNGRIPPTDLSPGPLRAAERDRIVPEAAE
jgi:hypothetical protein